MHRANPSPIMSLMARVVLLLHWLKFHLSKGYKR